jgi:hypothetical protein
MFFLVSMQPTYAAGFHLRVEILKTSRPWANSATAQPNSCAKLSHAVPMQRQDRRVDVTVAG